MKKKIQYQVYDQSVEREINYIPFRYILAITITLFEVAAIIGILVALCYYVPYCRNKNRTKRKCRLCRIEKQSGNCSIRKGMIVMAEEKKGFFARAFEDMKKSAAAQHEVDKAQFAAVRAENKANWEEAKLSPAQKAAKRQAELNEQLEEANKRIAEANARIDAAQNARQE